MAGRVTMKARFKDRDISGQIQPYQCIGEEAGEALANRRFPRHSHRLAGVPLKHGSESADACGRQTEHRFYPVR
jgi:hypothetical protein